MAGGRWKMIRTRFAKLADMVLVLRDVMDGDCIKEFDKAREQCDRDLQRRKGVADRKPGEVFPVSVESCAKATAALRKCMESKNVLAKHIVAMDLGIEQDEGRLLEPGMEVEEDGRWRWWTGMKKSEEDN